MANTYKNIVITPYISNNTYDPKIQFSGANTTVNTDITLYMYPDSNGSLSFEGSAGQLFSITNDLSNNLFGVNDVSGIPYIEVYANNLVSIVPISGNVGFRNTVPTHTVSINGDMLVNTDIDIGNSSVNATVNSTSLVVGNSTVNAKITTTQLSVANSTNAVTINPVSITVGTQVVNTTSITSALVNANLSGSYANLTGQVNAATIYATTSANIASAVQANATGVYTTGTVNAASHTVGTSTVANATGVYTGVVNGSSLTVGTAFTANATVVNAVSYYAGTTLIGNTTGPYGKTEGTLSVNNSAYLGGVVSTSYVNTSGAYTISGVHTHSANIISNGTLGVNSVIALVGSNGTAGQVITSNGNSNAYWSTPTTGTVTSVASGNGITGGTITSTGTLYATAGVGAVVNASGINILANSGIVANSTGTFVNANTGIVANSTGVFTNQTSLTTATINANLSGTYANLSGAVNAASMYLTTSANIASVVQANSSGLFSTQVVNAASLYSTTNTATIGTGTYFVSNGNVGIGTSTPLAKLNPSVGSIPAANIISGLTLTATYAAVTSVNSIDWNYAGQTAYPLRIGGIFNSDGTGMELSFYTSTAYTANGAERLRIDKNGNTGIGNTVPADKLSVNGTGYFAGNVTFKTGIIDSTGSQGTAGQVLTTNGSANVYWSTPVASVNVNATYTWTNLHTFNANVTVGNSSFGNTFLNSYTGISNPNTFGAGTLTTNASLNTLIVGPYTIGTGNSLVITTGSRLVII